MTFSKEIEDRLLEYRKARKSQTGKMMFCETAIIELLETALTGFVPPMPLGDRLAALEGRVKELESRSCQ
jgi:hypothetical protein